MESILNKAKQLKYNSLEYVDEEEIYDSKICIQEENCIIFFKELEDKIKLFWAANTKEDFFIGLKAVEDFMIKNMMDTEKLYIEFVPEDFLEEMYGEGYKIYSEYVDFWSYDIDNLEIREKENTYIRVLKSTEYESASDVTRSCRGNSRRFEGETNEWIKEWHESDDSQVFAAELDGIVVGICCVGLYGFESENGIVLWIREIAVRPQYQEQGIGRLLLENAILWGQQNNAKRSFLACDVENYNAIRLYESFGYKRKDGRGQINMEKVIKKMQGMEDALDITIIGGIIYARN